MGDALGCIVRDADEVSEPFPHAGSGMRAFSRPQDTPAALPILLGINSNSKPSPLDDSTTMAGIQAKPYPVELRPDLSAWHVPDTARSSLSSSQQTRNHVPDSARSILSSSRWCASARADAQQRGLEALTRLREGNLSFLAGAPMQKQRVGEVQPLAIISCCTPPPVPLDVIFGVDIGEIACVASTASGPCNGDDCGAAALEFSMATQREVALVVVMETVGVTDTSSKAAQRVWSAVERLLCQSHKLRSSIQKGAVILNAVLLDLRTGQIRFLGEHAKQSELSKNTSRDGLRNARRCHTKHFLEKELTPLVPADEALAILQSGNLRAANKPAPVALASKGAVGPRHGDSHKSGSQDPFAFIFMSFDPHRGDALEIESLFDLHPGEVAAISTVHWPTDGSEETYADCSEEEQWKSYVHLAEHLLATKTPRFLLVLGRVTVDAQVEEVQRAKDTVFQNMWNILTMSTVVKAGIANGQLLVSGAIYHGSAQKPIGLIEWLGSHPQQDALVAKMASLYPPTTFLAMTDVPEQMSPTSQGIVEGVLQDLWAGNQRFCNNDRQRVANDWVPGKLANVAKDNVGPKALILAGAHGKVRAPERLFDTRPGEILVHRTCGSICGRSQGCALRFLEDLLTNNSSIPLLLVLGDVYDPAVSFAANQVQHHGDVLKYPNAQMALEQMAPAVIQAMRTAGSQNDTAYHEEQLAEMSVEFHVRYVLERLHVNSDLILELVAAGRLEVRGAVVQTDGSLRLLPSADVHRLIAQRARVDRHKRKGVGLSQNCTQRNLQHPQ